MHSRCYVGRGFGMVNFEAARGRYPRNGESLSRYLLDSEPQLKVNELGIGLYVADERRELQTATTGDASVLLRYKNHDVSVISWQGSGEDLEVMQLQGARSPKSYRGTKGVGWERLFGDETWAVAEIPEAEIARVTMQHPLDIPGVEGQATELAIRRYILFAAYLSLVWSNQERMFVRDVK